ncbi:acetoacetate--CoA ligase [Saccharopolyspora mangrovi]|uniref:Acetoacetate--CoA ligase n=1 Tax=Saccharopolyspora mangrovi TaxID=3082379 RepID=A0ABU6AIU1_9PSEU|nr:acetoacetate--CoA ligase [Saccharopolyspora sp. S2-29]MEB3371368.1 acetoacetate--CoA ligase [Saccharopolyspora sp. S2-29]
MSNAADRAGRAAPGLAVEGSSNSEANSVGSGAVLREPDLASLGATGIGQYAQWLADTRGRAFADYDELWKWSVSEPEEFWASIWDYFSIRGSYTSVLGSTDMPGAQWFPGAKLNYAEHLLDVGGDPDRVAIIARCQTRGPIELTMGELADQVGRIRSALVGLGVGAGDRVVGYLPNIPEAVVAFLACASLGAIWACCPPEFGARSVVDRLAQVEPKVLISTTGYTYGDKKVDRAAELDAIRAGLPTVRHVIGVDYGDYRTDEVLRWDDLLAREPEALSFEQVGFDHPLWILFSSGTTGLPKAIVHGHGGILLEHLKTHALHLDIRPGDRILWTTTTAWTVWNCLVSALLVKATIVLTDGNPLYPDLPEQWRVIADTGATLFGASPAYVMACRKAGLEPAKDNDLSALRTLCITGAPLPAEGFDWLYEKLGPDVIVNSISGGTDICGNFLSGSPWQAVYRGELAGPALGVDVTAYDEDGNETVGAVGELVVRAPMPSMPVKFWGDEGDQRYLESYFDTYPSVWRHGDWVSMSDRRSFIIHGRSDATLNRGGVRLGTGEYYAVVENLPEVLDSLVVHLEDSEGGAGTLVLFVLLGTGFELDEAVQARIRAALRSDLSPRHVPDVIAAVPAIPRTLTGKKLEKPVKQILKGRPAREVVSPGAVTGFDAIDAFVKIGAKL